MLRNRAACSELHNRKGYGGKQGGRGPYRPTAAPLQQMHTAVLGFTVGCHQSIHSFIVTKTKGMTFFDSQLKE